MQTQTSVLRVVIKVHCFTHFLHNTDRFIFPSVFSTLNQFMFVCWDCPLPACQDQRSQHHDVSHHSLVFWEDLLPPFCPMNCTVNLLSQQFMTSLKVLEKISFAWFVDRIMGHLGWQGAVSIRLLDFFLLPHLPLDYSEGVCSCLSSSSSLAASCSLPTSWAVVCRRPLTSAWVGSYRPMSALVCQPLRRPISAATVSPF